MKKYFLSPLIFCIASHAMEQEQTSQEQPDQKTQQAPYIVPSLQELILVPIADEIYAGKTTASKYEQELRNTSKHPEKERMIAVAMQCLSYICCEKYLQQYEEKLQHGQGGYHRLKSIFGIEHVPNIHNLQILNLWNNKLTKLEGLSTLTNLQHLYLSHNKLTTIEELATFTNLQCLYLDRNKLSKLEGLSTLTNLQYLNLWSNKLTELEGLSTLTNLQHLTLSHNQLTTIKELSALINLQKLNLSHNKLSKLERLATLTNLQKLDLSCNTISSKDIKKLKNQLPNTTIYLELGKKIT